MKFHWGTGIALFYSLFVIAMVSMVVRSAQIDIELVQDNYYKHDLNYESFRKKRQNGQQNKVVLQLKQLSEQQQLHLSFPEANNAINGLVKLYRPSDYRKDLTYPIQVNEVGEMLIPTQGITPGHWRVQVDWEAAGQTYFQETELSL